MIIGGLTAAPSLNFYSFPSTFSYFAVPAIIPGALAMVISGEQSLLVLGLLAFCWFAITKTNADVLSQEGEEYASYEISEMDLEAELDRVKKEHRANQEELKIQKQLLVELRAAASSGQ